MYNVHDSWIQNNNGSDNDDDSDNDNTVKALLRVPSPFLTVKPPFPIRPPPPLSIWKSFFVISLLSNNPLPPFGTRVSPSYSLLQSPPVDET